MFFPQVFKVKVTEDRRVRLSIKVSEELILTQECSVNDFKVMMAEFRGQLKDLGIED